MYKIKILLLWGGAESGAKPSSAGGDRFSGAVGGVYNPPHVEHEVSRRAHYVMRRSPYSFAGVHSTIKLGVMRDTSSGHFVFYNRRATPRQHPRVFQYRWTHIIYNIKLQLMNKIIYRSINNYNVDYK